jgi:hypothetical protein
VNLGCGARCPRAEGSRFSCAAFPISALEMSSGSNGIEWKETSSASCIAFTIAGTGPSIGTHLRLHGQCDRVRLCHALFGIVPRDLNQVFTGPSEVVYPTDAVVNRWSALAGLECARQNAS